MNSLFAKGDHTAAAEHHAQALQLARALGDRYEQQYALSSLAAVSAAQGRSAEADPYRSQAISIRRDLGLDPAGL